MFLKIPTVGFWLNKLWFIQTAKYQRALKIDAVNAYGHEKRLSNVLNGKTSHKTYIEYNLIFFFPDCNRY